MEHQKTKPSPPTELVSCLVTNYPKGYCLPHPTPLLDLDSRTGQDGRGGVGWRNFPIGLVLGTCLLFSSHSVVMNYPALTAADDPLWCSWVLWATVEGARLSSVASLEAGAPVTSGLTSRVCGRHCLCCEASGSLPVMAAHGLTQAFS